jgi:flagellar assembly protein FliH
MSIAHLLEDFEGDLNAGSRRRILSDVQLEEIRLASFETGYTAGWEDAVKNLGETQVRVAEGLERRLKDMRFGYVEALAEMVAATEPVFRAIVDKLLPEHTDAILAGALVGRLVALAREAGDAGLVVKVPTGTRSYIAPAVEGVEGVQVRVEEDDGLAPEQASVCLQDREHEVNLAAFGDALREAIEATLFQISEERKHA